MKDATEPQLAHPFTRDQLAAYFRSGLELADVAARHNCSARTVWKWANRWGLYVSPRLHLSDEQWREIAASAGTDARGAVLAGCTPRNVMYHRHRLGIVSPYRADANRLKRKALRLRATGMTHAQVAATCGRSLRWSKWATRSTITEDAAA